MYHTIVNDIKNFVFGPAKAPVYGFGRNRKQKFVMSFTIRYFNSYDKLFFSIFPRIRFGIIGRTFL